MATDAYSQDLLTRIYNVQWGGDVIVVMVDGSALESQPSATHQIIGDGATLLSTWRTPYQAGGFQPGFTSRAYRVSGNADEFIRTIAPAVSADAKFWIDVLVFALDESKDDEGLQRAIDGTMLAIPAVYQSEHPPDSDIPTNMAPPGLLWFVEAGEMDTAQSLTWKIRSDEHRLPDPVPPLPNTPPNVMVQCYPLGPTYSAVFSGGFTETWTGYRIFAYRLDSDGTATVYGKLSSDGVTQNIDAAWKQTVSAGENGIPFQDPPPLIGSDLI